MCVFDIRNAVLILSGKYILLFLFKNVSDVCAQINSCYIFSSWSDLF